MISIRFLTSRHWLADFPIGQPVRVRWLIPGQLPMSVQGVVSGHTYSAMHGYMITTRLLRGGETTCPVEDVRVLLDASAALLELSQTVRCQYGRQVRNL